MTDYEAIKDDKFIVFKRDEFYKWLYSEEAKSALDVFPIAIPDAVVIRRQDVFAPPALDAYANAIICVVETMTHGFGASGERMKRLQDIADYFHAQANLAWQEPRKLPD